MAQVIEMAMENRLLSVHTAIPVIVERIYFATGLIDAKIVVERTDSDGVPYPVATLTDIPIVQISSAKYTIRMPVEAGDEGIVIFNERDIGTFLATGEIKEPVVKRKHSYSDAVFIPSMLSAGKAPTIPTILTLEKVGGAVIEVGDNIKITGNLEVTGEVKGATVTDGTIDLASHTHNYNDLSDAGDTPRVTDVAN